MKKNACLAILLLFAFLATVNAQNFTQISESHRLKLLGTPPKKGASIVFDTDTYNEIDDQFALVYALLSKESFNVEAVYAAPFSNERADNPKLGMEMSHDEILRVLSKLKVNPTNFAFKGSTKYLTKELIPEKSPAIEDLISRAMKHSADDPLYVVAVGAITNVANAILLKPEITKNIVVVWLGGSIYSWPDTKEFNMKQDKDAVNVIFNCGVPMVQFPCIGVVSHFHTTVPEMEYYLKGKNDISNYLLKIFKEYHNDHYAWSKVLWDVTVLAYFINSDWTPSQLVHAPMVSNMDTYSFDNSRHFIRTVFYINRDEIFKDFFLKIQTIK